MLTDISQDWNGSAGKWQNSYQYIYTYNAGNMQVTEIAQNWKASAGKWKNSYKYTNTFNAANKLMSQLFQSWDDDSKTWSNQSLSLYTYASGNVLTYVRQYWSDSLYSWMNISKRAYTYDGNGNQTTQLYQEWNQDNSKWKNLGQYLYTYDAQNNLLSEAYQAWESGMWKNEWQYLFTYNGANDRITATEQKWVLQTADWKNVYFDSSVYDNNHNELMRLGQDWKNAENAFINDRMLEYTYNSYNQPTSQTSTTWNAGGFWQPTSHDYQERFYYEEYGETGIRQATAAAGSTNIYPSPAQTIVNIDLQWDKDQDASICLFDGQGRLLSQWHVASTKDYHTTLPVASLPAGSYTLKIKGQYDHVSRQIAVVH